MNCSYKQGENIINSVKTAKTVTTTLDFHNTSALMKQGHYTYVDKKYIYLQNTCFRKHRNILQILMLVQDIFMCTSIPFSSI